MSRTIYAAIESMCEFLYMPSPGSEPIVTRDRPMEVLCVGLPRSGTQSLKQALEILGCVKIYHGWDLIAEPHPAWKRACYAKERGIGKFKKADWDNLLGDCRGITDMPAAYFAEELMNAYPEAKVIVNTRDVDDWFRSYNNNIATYADNILVRCLWNFESRLWFTTALRNMHDEMFNHNFQKYGKQVGAEHGEKMKALASQRGMPALEFNFKQGWGPLCKFLDKPIPNEPFPSSNAGEEFLPTLDRLTKERIKIAMRNLVIFASIGTAFLAIPVYFAMT